MKQILKQIGITSAVLILFGAVMFAAEELFLWIIDPTEEVKYIAYTDDYPVTHAEELAFIFGNYTVGQRMERHIEGESCSCGYHQDTIDYWAWEITYTDSAGNTHTCELENRSDISTQQHKWMEDQIENHTLFLIGDSSNGLLVEEITAYCEIVDVCSSAKTDEDLDNLETAEEYRRNLDKLQQPVALHSLDYEKLFANYPISVTLMVYLDDEHISAADWPANFDKHVERLDGIMNAALTGFGGDANLAVRLKSSSEFSEGEHILCCIRGESVETDYWNFDKLVYKAYSGIFWD